MSTRTPPLPLTTGFALLMPLAACGRDAPRDDRDASPAPPFELRDVVAAELAARPEPGDPPALDDARAADLAGLVELAGDPDFVSVARDDVARMASDAPAVWTWLAERARDAVRPEAERSAAVDLVAADEPRGAAALLALATDADPAWVRARAAWRLAEAGPDHLVPDLVLRLKYEKDHETVVWIAAAVARHDNLAGLPGLSAIANDPSSPARTLASAQLAALVERYGRESVEALASAWEEDARERQFGAGPRSDAFRHAVLGWIGRLGEFQLRGVDDARFILERLDATAARELARALHDRDVYIRVHSAQCLQRMGRRGAVAGSELLAALGDPELAPHAAIALGKVGHAPARGTLTELATTDGPAALRLAAVRGLGHLESLPPEDARAVLVPLLAAEPAELAHAAAESLARRDPGCLAAIEALAGYLEDPRVDSGSTARVLGEWLQSLDDAEALARWSALEPPAGRVETPEERRARQAARARLVRDLVGERDRRP